MADKDVSSDDSSRRMSSDSDSTAENAGSVSSHSYSGSMRGYSRNDSFGRAMRPSYHMYAPLRRTGSNETMSSQSTLVNRLSILEAADDDSSIMDLLPPGIRPDRLTQSSILAHSKIEARRQRLYGRTMYEYERKEREEEGGRDEQPEATVEDGEFC